MVNQSKKPFPAFSTLAKVINKSAIATAEPPDRKCFHSLLSAATFPCLRYLEIYRESHMPDERVPLVTFGNLVQLSQDLVEAVIQCLHLRELELPTRAELILTTDVVRRRVVVGQKLEHVF